jgi:hypothetical protein
MFLKLNPRKYKYNAYITVSANVFLLSNMTIVEYDNVFAAIALVKLTQPPYQSKNLNSLFEADFKGLKFILLNQNILHIMQN